MAQEPDAAPAERELADPTDEQYRLNDEAARAIGEGDYTKAVSYLQEALHIGELNITYLNLGRAYQYMGRCEQARAALEKVSGAPVVRKPPASFIDKKAVEFMAELDSSCKVDQATGEVETNQSAPPPREPPESVPMIIRVESSDNGRETLGWVSAVSGVVVAGGGLGLHLWAESLRNDVSSEPDAVDAEGRWISPTQAQVEENQDTANTLDTVGFSMGILGGAAIATGAYLLLSGDEDEASAVTIGPRSDGRGFVVGGRF